MYESFYGLNERPFQIVPNPGYLYLSPKHQNALLYLEYGLMESVGFILLTGEIGIGKTTLIRHILNQIGPDMEVAVIFNTNLSSDQLLSLILQEFEIIPEDGNKAKKLDKLYNFLIEKYAEKKRVLLIIDEAQNLSQEALEEVRMLSNLQSDDHMLLQIMLVGQPELKTKLKNPGLAQLTQRIAVNYHLSALTREETGLYIDYRLEKAGGKPNLFTMEAVDMIYKASGGIPRSINLLCDAALVYGFADELDTIDTPVIEQVMQDKGGMGIVCETGDEDFSRSEGSSEESGEVFLHRLQALEAEVRKLEMQVEWQIEELERKGENFKDTLVSNLKNLLLLERKRSDKLLINYSLLKKKYDALQKARSEDSQAFSESSEGGGKKNENREKKGNRPDSRLNISTWFGK